MSESLVGLVVDEVEFEVERGKVGEFARATFARDPVHTDVRAAREAGFGSMLATPTHVVVAGHQRDQRALVERLGVALERIVVGSVKWRYARPLQVGDALRGVRRVVGEERREGKRGGSMRLITLETEYVDVLGATVVTQRETLIEKGVPS
ncbi:FAS1-like dehydratase domain-containing protein [Saccharopolyspora endophytica]|uniref:MaoC family dehydratase N-terminal domain-containing protein n=1 Tax=Saccharopolyspora endophytica TaxID=543886 RepID=A0ABS5DBH1_9PSEU|nr:MaoC family dehydratase N-terminal domain-containing protein [Saccharopolyspora endophytica]MBQ0923512.1 MaoC family dehydratase N-terminal domain-containing protein [Saccharopolyspora endophytica]